MIDWDDFLASNENIHIISGEESELDNFVLEGRYKYRSLCINIVRGKRCVGVKGLFQEFAASLQFPYYFGGNWEALSECLSDLEWLPGDGYVIFIADTTEIMRENSENFRLLIDVLLESVRYWEGNFRSGSSTCVYKIVFHCVPGDFDELSRGISI